MEWLILLSVFQIRPYGPGGKGQCLIHICPQHLAGSGVALKSLYGEEPWVITVHKGSH